MGPMSRLITRRDLLKRTVLVGAAVTGGGYLLAGCGSSESGSGLSCMDTTGLTDAQKQTRTQLQYVDTSTQSGKTCSNCSLFTSAGDNACGTCTVVPGKIHPGGWCASWAAIAT